MYSIYKNKLIGEGTYGKVYSAELEKDDEEFMKVAVKRNFCQEESIGISCIRELNYLEVLKSHPSIVLLASVSEGDPFKNLPMTPIAGNREQKEDSHHFILELSDTVLSKYIRKKTPDYFSLKIIMCQILLGLEYCHSKKILHRDLKPSNILIKEEDGTVYAKICDFGLSCRPNEYIPSTPGAVTSWYRAPEICCEHEDYSFPTDIWSFGCIAYEMVFREPFISINSRSKKEDQALFNKILEKIPEKFEMKEIRDYAGNDMKITYDLLYDYDKKTFTQLLSKNIQVRIFNSTKGSYSEFGDLLSNILRLYPSTRFTATQCLEHPFFNGFKDYISEVREKFPPVDWESQEIHIIDCLERRLAANIAFSIYNKRKSFKWYKHNILFHGFRLFDQYLAYEYNNIGDNIKNNVEKGKGKILTEKEVYLYFFTCLYIMYKFFSCLVLLLPWDQFFPSFISSDEKNLKVIEKLELLILQEICNNVVFKDTFLELLDNDFRESDRFLTEEYGTFENEQRKNLEVKNALIKYASITSDYKGTMKKLYDKLKKQKENLK